VYHDNYERRKMMTDNILEMFLAKAGSVPGVRIERDDFLRKTFGWNYRKKINEIMMYGPIRAGIPVKEVGKLANQAIRAEALQTTVISAGTGVFGGLAMAAAIPADLIQFYGHLFRMIQKLMYLYGWEEDVFDGNGNLDDTTANVLVLYLGLMFGVEAAGKVLAHVASVAAKRMMRDVPIRVLKALFTKQAFREIIKKIIKAVGVKTTLKMTVVAGSKIVPIVGAVTSGALTASFFIPMSKRLKKYLEDGEMGRFEEDEEDLESLYKESESF